MNLPYWLWRLTAFGMHAHMKEHLNLYQLSDMTHAPDELLDAKGRYVKKIAVRIIMDAYKGDY